MKKKSLFIGMAALIFPSTMMAQYTIYPVPHEQTAGTGKVSFPTKVTVSCDKGIDQSTKNRLTNILSAHGITATFLDDASSVAANIYLGVNGTNGRGNAVAAELGLSLDVLSKEGKFDRHIVSLTDGGQGTARLLVLGENTDATFCGLASLEQMLDNGIADLETVTINDYADLKERGIIEGFYGKPYSSSVRKDLLRFMMRYKMNCYVYGPKSDPYHSGKWGDPYPTELTESQKASGFVCQQDLKDFTSVAADTKVSVVWAIHPGNAIMNSATVVDDVMKKFGSMYDLGFRQFAIFADDVNVPGDEATMKKTADNVGAIQHAIEDKWNIAGADPADTVKALRFTPQIYCRAFAGPDSQFNSFFQAMSSLPANVTVYYTGGGVWSVPNNNDLNTLQAQFGRQAIWWWNYPCNDNGTGPSEIYPLDMKSNFVDMPNVGGGSIASELTASNQGILCNPMEQGDASKTAIFSAGDYCWNNKGFDNMKSWEASFKGVLPGNESAQKAYRFLAPYLSKNDPESLNTLISDYKKSGDATVLNALMDEIVNNCEVMLALETAGTESEQLLLTDIKPWVVRLRDMAITTKTFLTCNSMSNVEEAWSTYMGTSKKAAALSTDAAYMTKHMSGFGSDGISTSERLTHASYRYLTPFVTGYLNAHAVDKFFAKGNSVSVFTNNAANADKASVRGGSSNLYVMSTSALEMADGEYVGIALANPSRLTAINVKSSLADTYEALYSLDGKVWNKVEADGTAPEGYVHYVVLVNKSGEKQTLRFKANVFSIDLATSAEVAGASAPTTSYWQDHNATYLYDGNYSTFTCLNREQQVNDVYQINLKKAVNIENVRICMGTTNGDNAKKALVQISEDNSKWMSLNVAGTKSVEYGIDLPQNKVVATVDGADVIATDFIPTDTSGKFKPTKARYVRFKLTEVPSGNKWLRLNEIEVNGKPANELTAMQDESGIKIGNATDGDASTSTSVYTLTTASGGEFVYNLLNAAYVKAVTFFCTPETVDGLKFAVTNDGTTWDDLAAESNNGVVKVSLGEDQRAAKAIKIVWTGKTVPAIHEVAETAVDTDTPPVVDGIEQVTAGTTTGAPIMTLANGIVTAQSALGLAKAEAFTADGRCIFSQSLGGVKQAVIPVAAGGQQMVIVKVTLVDGTAETVKAIIK